MKLTLYKIISVRRGKNCPLPTGLNRRENVWAFCRPIIQQKHPTLSKQITGNFYVAQFFPLEIIWYKNDVQS